MQVVTNCGIDGCAGRIIFDPDQQRPRLDGHGILGECSGCRALFRLHGGRCQQLSPPTPTFEFSGRAGARPNNEPASAP